MLCHRRLHFWRFAIARGRAVGYANATICTSKIACHYIDNPIVAVFLFDTHVTGVPVRCALRTKRCKARRPDEAKNAGVRLVGVDKYNKASCFFASCAYFDNIDCAT